jgi:hypothetical protein
MSEELGLKGVPQGQRMNDLMPIFRKIGLSVGMQLRRESSG